MMYKQDDFDNTLLSIIQNTKIKKEMFIMPCSPWVKYTPEPGPTGALSIKLCAHNNGSNVDAEMVQYGSPPWGKDYRTYWTMSLQRQTSSGGWTSIGTRTGYISEISASKRTFTNVKTNGGRDRLRVRVDFTRGLHSSSQKTLFTPNWSR